MPRSKPKSHPWQFSRRFRRHAFGWRSQPAIQRVREAVSEIKKVNRTDKLLAAEGAVRFLEKVSPALEHVDSSSGAIGTAVDKAIEALVPIIAQAPATEALRDQWLERLWIAYEEDQMPYIELLGEHWAELCASKEKASEWADNLIDICRTALNPDPDIRGFFAGTTNCLDCLFAAGRYQEIIELIDTDPHPIWHYRQYKVKALAALGRPEEAIRYAEQEVGINDSPHGTALVCEQILLDRGHREEAYRRYACLANQRGTYLAWFRAVAKKYPEKKPEEILADLVRFTEGDEGKWFAAAKDAGLFEEAIQLANQSPCAPQTLTRAARDFAEKRPVFAMESGIAALRWLTEGYGYEITGIDVLDAYAHTMTAAENAGRAKEALARIHWLVAQERHGERFVTKVLGRELGLSR